MSKFRELAELSRVRWLLFVREPEALFWVFVFPLVLAAVLGFAFRSGGAPTSHVGVLDTDVGRALEERLALVEGVEVSRFASEEEAAVALRSADVDALVLGGEPPLVRLDPAREQAETARLRIDRAFELDPLAEPPPARITVEPVSERGSRYIDFLFPGLLGMNLMGTGMWSIGFSVAELRQRKVLKRMLVTPMRRSSFLMSFLIARLAFLAAEVGMLMLFASWVLGVPFRANVLGFGLVCLLGAFVFSGLGLLAASRAKTIQGVSGILNFVMMPMWLFSGVFFSYERFPDILHPLLRMLPLTALNDALREMTIDGASLLEVGPEIAVQLVWAVLGFLAALKLFRWE